ncbi:MAG: hypothetical protein IR159_05575, partial [Brevundimonas sp.]|nr:hypothetical protein [Brevundimonas sp.]
MSAPWPPCIFGANGDDILYGDEGDDQLWGWGGLGQLFGGDGNDMLQGGGEEDYLEGGEGNDLLIGNMGRDVLIGGAGNDDLLGDSSGSVGAGGHDDILDGGDGDDRLNGGGGDDILRDAGGNDDLIGGMGFNIVDYSAAHAAVRVSTYAGWDVNTGNWARQDTGGSGIDLLVDISGLIGTRFDDELSGRDDAFDHTQGWVFHEFLDGGAGDDLIKGASGDDTIWGGTGDDTLDGGLGDDVIDGGAGWDTLLLSGARGDYRILQSGDDWIVKGADGADHVSGVEILRFSDGSEIDLARQVGSGPGKPAGDDAFVLPPRPDDQPRILPGAEPGKNAGEPLVLPGAPAAEERLFAGLEARLDLVGGWMPTLDPDGGLAAPSGRTDDWLF